MRIGGPALRRARQRKDHKVTRRVARIHNTERERRGPRHDVSEKSEKVSCVRRNKKMREDSRCSPSCGGTCGSACLFFSVATCHRRRQGVRSEERRREAQQDDHRPRRLLAHDHEGVTIVFIIGKRHTGVCADEDLLYHMPRPDYVLAMAPTRTRCRCSASSTESVFRSFSQGLTARSPCNVSSSTAGRSAPCSFCSTTAFTRRACSSRTRCAPSSLTGVTTTSR